MNLMFVPVEAGLFERLIAFLQLEGATCSFAVQLTGTIGYIGSIIVLLLSAFSKMNVLEFFKAFSLVSCIGGIISLSLGTFYVVVWKPRQLRGRRVLQEEKVDIGGEEKKFKKEIA